MSQFRVSRAELKLAESEGVCPECRLRICPHDCRKRRFDYAYSVGFHDGANGMERHDHAFIVEMLEAGEYEGDGE